MRVTKLNNGQTFGITDEMSGKMAGMWSLNTSPETNPFCLSMREIKGVICQSCYSKKTERRWKNCHTAWVNNGNTLSQNDLKEDEIPIIKGKDIFRFQAHGDLINVTHYLNLVRIAKANPEVTFVLWTKNLAVVRAGGSVRESNLIYMYSTPKINELKPHIPKGFDRVFTVYTRPFVKEHGIKINCGAKNCFKCRTCYTKGGDKVINELIKSNGHKD